MIDRLHDLEAHMFRRASNVFRFVGSESTGIIRKNDIGNRSIRASKWVEAEEDRWDFQLSSVLINKKATATSAMTINQRDFSRYQHLRRKQNLRHERRQLSSCKVNNASEIHDIIFTVVQTQVGLATDKRVVISTLTSDAC